MNIPPSEKPRLTQLLREIRSVQAGRAWSLPIRYALDAVDSTVEDFLRHGYTSAHSRKASEMGEQSQTDLSHLHLNEKNFALFLEFLEAQGMRSARYFFRKLGYYFAPGQKKGMLAFFRQRVMDRIRERTENMDQTLLESVVRSSADLSQATSFYGRVTISLEKEISCIAKEFLIQKKIRRHSISQAMVEDHLKESLWSGNAKDDDTPSPLWDKILVEALGPIVQAKYGQPESEPGIGGGTDARTGKERVANRRTSSKRSATGRGKQEQDTGQPPTPTLEIQVKSALTVLGLANDRLPELPVLKKRFYQLIKEWHPDIHLEKGDISQTQQIIDAYQIVQDVLKK